MRNALSALIIISVLFGCGFPSTSSSTQTAPAYEYNGPGSQWDIALDGTSKFTLNESSSIGVSLSGTYSATATGFAKATVTTSSNPFITALNTTAYFIEIPGQLMLSQALLNDQNYTQILALLAKGSCPRGSFQTNWINFKRDINTSSAALFGTFTYTDLNATASFPHRYNLISSDMGEQNLSSLNCNQGLANMDNATAYMHASANTIIHTGISTPADDTDDDLILSIGSEHLSSIAVFTDEYIGFVYDAQQNTHTLSPAMMSLGKDGIGRGYIYTDVDNNVVDSSNPINIQINQINIPSNGFINLGINGAQSRCVAHTNLSGSNRKVIFCTGDNPKQPGMGYGYTMLLVSK